MGSVEFRIDVVETAGSWVVSCKSAAGSAVRVVPTPFSDLELERRLSDLEIAIVRSTGTPTTRRGTTPAQVARAFGAELTGLLLDGDTAILFDRCREKARRDGMDLRVLISPVGPNVARVPWEFATDPGKDYEHLALRTPVVRSPHLMEQVPPLTVRPPLRVLGVVSRPSDSPPLEVAAERQSITDALSGLSSELVTVEWLEGDRWTDLAGALRNQQWHVLHYVGHGGFDQDLGTGYIELSDARGRATRVPATDLARHVSENRSLRLVVLNSCESATSSTDEGVFSSTAARLMREGLPAVVAMQYEISDPGALAFSFALYDALARNRPLDQAVTQARDTVKMTTRSLEWATPVLFLASDETRIFSVHGEHAATSEPAQPQQVGGAVREVLSSRSSQATGTDRHVQQPAPQPSASQPSASQPSASQPSASQPSASQPSAPQPAAPQPSVPAPPGPQPSAPPSRAPQPVAVLMTAPLRALAVLTPDLVGCVGADGTLRVTGLRDGRERARCTSAPGGRLDPATLVRGTPWVRHAVTVHASGAVVVWDLESESPVVVVPRPKGATVQRAAVSASGLWIATTGSDLVLRVLGTDGAEALSVRLLPAGSPTDQGAQLRSAAPVAFASDDASVLVGADDGQVREVGTTGACRAGWRHPAAVTSIVPGPSAGTFTTGSADGAVCVWSQHQGPGLLQRLETGAPVQTVRRHGSVVAAVSADRRCRVWDAQRGYQRLLDVRGDTAGLTELGGRRGLVAASREGRVEVWELAGTAQPQEEGAR